MEFVNSIPPYFIKRIIGNDQSIREPFAWSVSLVVNSHFLHKLFLCHTRQSLKTSLYFFHDLPYGFQSDAIFSSFTKNQSEVL